MEILPIELFGVAVELPFEGPRSLANAKLDQLAANMCGQPNNPGLQPQHFRLKRFDDLFDYELVARFFGENGQMTIGPDRAKIMIRNARTMADWGIIHQTLVKFYQNLQYAPTTVSHLSTHVHARFPSANDRDEFLKQFSFNTSVARPAALGYVRIPDWEMDIRVLMERSNAVPDSVFVAWDTQFKNSQDWESFFTSLPNLMENSANLFELAFDPLR